MPLLYYLFMYDTSTDHTNSPLFQGKGVGTSTCLSQVGRRWG